MMILVVGLVVAFGAGFVVGNAVVKAPPPQIINTSPYPANYDVTKAHQELLQSCYKFLGDQVVNLKEQALKTEQTVNTAVEELSKVCHQKKIVIETPGAADIINARKKATTH